MGPLVSIIIPHLWNRKLICLKSIKKQTYNNIEIIIIVDNEKKGPGGPRNEGAKMARGKYLFFCDDDIKLDINCIRAMVEMLEETQDCDFVYSDYKKTGTLKGIQQGQPWDPILLEKVNYVSTMALIRKEAFPYFDETLERYLDWDLWLTMAKNGSKGFYYPYVLFTAVFKKSGISMRGSYDRIQKTELIKRKHGIKHRTYSIILPVYNELQMTKNCLESIIRNTAGDYEVIIVDDGSDPDVAKELDKYEDIFKIIHNENQMHHSYCCNRGFEASRGEYIIFLNNDTLVTQGWNLKLYNAFISCPAASCVGPITSHAASCQQLPMLRDTKDQIDLNGVNVMQAIVNQNLSDLNYIAKITGFCLFTSKYLLNKYGTFEQKIKAGGNEAEWILRLNEKGLHPIINTGTYVHHFGGVSYAKTNRKELWEDGKKYIIEKYGKEKLDYLEQNLYLDMYEDFERNLIKGA